MRGRANQNQFLVAPKGFLDFWRVRRAFHERDIEFKGQEPRFDTRGVFAPQTKTNARKLVAELG
jgi:hypothetical protein